MKAKYIKWILFFTSLMFGQLANYCNPDIPLWGKFGITAGSLGLSGLILAIGDV